MPNAIGEVKRGPLPAPLDDAIPLAGLLALRRVDAFEANAPVVDLDRVAVDDAGDADDRRRHGVLRPHLEPRTSHRQRPELADLGYPLPFQISTEGRAVPWAADDVVTSIAGGIEPGEVRRVTVPRIYMPSEAGGRFFTTVTINDVADQDKRLLIGDVRVIDWDETRLTRICGSAGQVPIAPAPIAAAKAAVGSPLTGAEKDRLRLALQRC